MKRLDILSGGAFFVFAMSVAITPICFLRISETFQADFSAGGSMEAVRTLLVLLVLLVSSFLARRWGKKALIAAGLYMIAAGLLFVSLAGSFAQVIAAIAVVGFGGGFVEALVNPLVRDLHPHDTGRYLNNANAFFPAGALVSVLIFGEILSRGVGWRFVYAFGAGLGLIVALCVSISRFPEPVEAREGWHSLREIVSLKGFWVFAAAIFLGAGAESAFTFWSASYIQIYHVDVPRAGAAGMAVFAAAMAAGRWFTGRLAGRFGLRPIMLASACLGIVASALVLFADSLAVALVLLAAAGFSTACFWPSILSEAGDTLQVGSTRLFIMLSCVGIAGFGFSPWVMGVIGDRWELKAGFFVVPVMFGLLIAVLIYEGRLTRKAPSESAKRP